MTTKSLQILFIILLFSCNSTKNTTEQNAELLIGTWIIEKSTFNGQNSPVPKNTNLKFASDKSVEITLPKFGENNEDIIGIGSWKRKDGIVNIEWKDSKLWGENQQWQILKLTDKKLEWEMKMDDGLQAEIYNRKK